MLKKQKRQIRGEIWCLRKLLHCWSDHDCSSRKLFACREVMSRIAPARPAARHRYAHERNSGSDIAERARHCGDGMELMVGTHGPWGVSKLFFAKQSHFCKWQTRVSCTVLSKSFSETNTFPNRWMAGAQLLRLEIMQTCKLNLEMKWSRRQDGLALYIRVHFKITYIIYIYIYL